MARTLIIAIWIPLFPIFRDFDILFVIHAFRAHPSHIRYVQSPMEVIPAPHSYWCFTVSHTNYVADLHVWTICSLLNVQHNMIPIDSSQFIAPPVAVWKRPNFHMAWWEKGGWYDIVLPWVLLQLIRQCFSTQSMCTCRVYVWFAWQQLADTKEKCEQMQWKVFPRQENWSFLSC